MANDELVDDEKTWGDIAGAGLVFGCLLVVVFPVLLVLTFVAIALIGNWVG